MTWSIQVSGVKARGYDETQAAGAVPGMVCVLEQPVSLAGA